MAMSVVAPGFLRNLSFEVGKRWDLQRKSSELKYLTKGMRAITAALALFKCQFWK